MSTPIPDSLYHEILEHEVRLARSVALATRRAKPFGVWEVLIPIIFILEYMRRRQNRELFVDNFIFTKKLALKAAKDMHVEAIPFSEAFGKIEKKTQELLETLDRNIYSEPIQQAQLKEMRLLVGHYKSLFNASGGKYADCILAAYPDRKSYLAFLQELRQTEKQVAEAAITTVGERADRDMVARIEACTHRLRLKSADGFYSRASL